MRNMSWEEFSKSSRKAKLKQADKAYAIAEKRSKLKDKVIIGQCQILNTKAPVSLATIKLDNGATLVDAWICSRVKKGTKCKGAWRGATVVSVS